MAGTTVRDAHEVEAYFAQAAATGLHASAARSLAVQGRAKRAVFEQLWREQLGAVAPADEFGSLVDRSYQVFREVLEAHYRTQPVLPTAGCLDLFAYLKSRGIRIALTTGFYREVTDLILHRLG